MPDRLDFQKLSFGVRRMGWIRFWIQVVLGIVVVGVLLFNNIGGSLAAIPNVPWDWGLAFRSHPWRSSCCCSASGRAG